MKLYSIEPDGSFREYVKTPFQQGNLESTLERWLERNAHAILEEQSLLIIGRQVATNLGSIIDLLAVDRHGDIVVIELKRDKTPRETLAQALEYASFVEGLDADQLEAVFRAYNDDDEANLAAQHREYFGLAETDAISFNKDQKIVIVGQEVTKEIRQTSSFLRAKGLGVTCVEFAFFTEEDGRQLLSNEVVVGREAKGGTQVLSGTMPTIDERIFEESLDEYGQLFFHRLLEFVKSEEYQINWGTNGFSFNAKHGNGYVALAFCYRPNSVYGQSLYTVLYRQGGALAKAGVPQDIVEKLVENARQTRLFTSAGNELKVRVDRAFSDDEFSQLSGWLRAVAFAINEHGVTTPSELSDWQKFCREQRLLGKDFKEIGVLWRSRKMDP